MSLRVVKEGTMRILAVSDKNLSPSSLKAANGTWYIQESGTIMISGSCSKSATGAMTILWHKRRFVVISLASSSSRMGARFSSSSDTESVSSNDRSSQLSSGKMPRPRKLSEKNSSKPGNNPVTLLGSRLTFVSKNRIALFALRIQNRTDSSSTEMYRHAQSASLVIIFWMPHHVCGLPDICCVTEYWVAIKSARPLALLSSST